MNTRDQKIDEYMRLAHEHLYVSVAETAARMSDAQLDDCIFFLKQPRAKTERDLICEWLRVQAELPGGLPGATLYRIADAIERGEHTGKGKV